MRGGPLGDLGLVQMPRPGHSFVPMGQDNPTDVCVLGLEPRKRKQYSRLVSPAEPSRGARLSPSGGQGFPPASHLGWRMGTCRFQDLKEM